MGEGIGDRIKNKAEAATRSGKDDNPSETGPKRRNEGPKEPSTLLGLGTWSMPSFVNVHLGSTDS